MDGYKKLIKSQKMRMNILKTLSFVLDEIMIRFLYWLKLERKLNINKLQRYTEKLQWMKLHYRNPVMTQCVDKFAVCQYIRDHSLEEILTELYGNYDKVEDIAFNQLSNKFIMKTTNGSGMYTA